MERPYMLVCAGPCGNTVLVGRYPYLSAAETVGWSMPLPAGVPWGIVDERRGEFVRKPGNDGAACIGALYPAPQ